MICYGYNNNDIKSRIMKAVFLDRDGTINVEEPNYLTDIRKLKIFDEAFIAIQLFNCQGFKTIVVTNQSCVGRGVLQEKELIKINTQLQKTLAKKNAHLDSIYYCPHTPDDQCLCRKPKIGLLQRAVQEHHVNLEKSFFIGDREFDIYAGKAAGCKTVLVLTGAGKQMLERFSLKPDFIATHLLEAAQWVIQQSASL